MRRLRMMTWEQVSARRLARAGLAEPVKAAGAEGAAGSVGVTEGVPVGVPEVAAEVVAAMCGAHAQVLSAAELSVAMRIEGATRADVRDALWRDRTLVKTYGPRGTVHLLPTADLPMWTGALSALPVGSGNGGGAVGALLTAEQAETVVAAIGDALADAELTVDELTEAVAERAGAWAADPVMDAFQTKWPRWRAATALAAHRGALCFGANRGRKVTYTNPHRWLPGFEPQPAEVAVAGVVRRYLHAYGPATPQHFAKWMAAPVGWANALFARLAEEGAIEEVEVVAGGAGAGGAEAGGTSGGGAAGAGPGAVGSSAAGVTGWVVAGDTGVPEEPPAGVRLLPYFDAYAVAGQPRELLFPGRAYERALAGGQAGNFPVLLIDGTAAGVWHQRRSGRRLHVTVEPLDRLTAPHRRELEAQVERVGEILEARPELTVGEVTVGPHA